MPTPPFSPPAEPPAGFPDRSGNWQNSLLDLIACVIGVYRSYGFAPLDTPAVEYAGNLGVWLPEQDQPDAGIFALRAEENGAPLALRYDLTAPLARYAARHYDSLPKPFRRCQWGQVFRNEKPAPGRERQFFQADADTIGAAQPAADAELCLMMSAALAAAGLAQKDFTIRINDRRLVDSVLAQAGLNAAQNPQRRDSVLRALDKRERLGEEGVRALLGKGRRDASGDFTQGAQLADDQIEHIIGFANLAAGRQSFCQTAQDYAQADAQGESAFAALAEMDRLFTAAGYDENHIVFDPAIVRGLGYYTGPVYEAVLARPPDGFPASIAAGGRYDDLLAKFRAEPVPSCGVSVGISRLASLRALTTPPNPDAPIIVLVMNQDGLASAQTMARELRAAGLAAEFYLGSGAMKAQMKYADKRGAPFVVIEGEEERAAGEITLKDMAAGIAQSAAAADSKTWRAGRFGQTRIPRANLAAEIKKCLQQKSGEKYEPR